MATTTRTLSASVSGTVYTTNLNAALEAIDTCHSGTTAPTDELVAGKLWLDTTTTPALLKVYDNGGWNLVYSGRGNLDVEGTLSATTLLGDGSGLTGIVAGLAWVRKTTTFTAANNDAIIADTSGGAWALTLPAAPSIGDLVRVVDGADWATNNLTVGRNSSTIEGDAADLVMNIGGVSVDFVYDGTTWQIYTQVGVSSGTVVTETGTQTLTNKTLTSPSITGTPTAPTATVGTNTTQVATTAFTKAAVDAATPDWELIYNTADPAAGTITLIAGKTFSDYQTLCFAGGHDDLLGKYRMTIPVSDFELGDVCVIFSAYISAWVYVRVTHLTDTTFTLAKSTGLYHLGAVWGLK